jgi:hypothetical protein
MSETMAAPQPAPAAPMAPSAGSRIPIRLAALTPLWLFLVLIATGRIAGGFFGPPPPEILGIPLGIWLVALVAGWMLIGLGLVWEPRSPLIKLLVLLVFTIPATLVLILGPAVILTLQNVGSER